MATGASAIDHPDPTIVDFVENSRMVPRGMSARFERLPGGVSSDIWLVHTDDTSFCVKRALAQLRPLLKNLMAGDPEAAARPQK